MRRPYQKPHIFLLSDGGYLMAKVKYRKARPAVAWYVWLDRDGCWFCKNRNNCGGCKANKREVAFQKEKQKRKEKAKLKKIKL